MGSGECTDATCPVDGGYFSYEPSQVGNGILLGCFVVLIPLTTFFGIRYRIATYSALLMTGLVLEVLCYIGRLLIHGNPRQTSYFVIFLLGSSLGPTFITMAIFYVLPRVMTIYDHDLVEVRPKYFNYLFFAISLLTLTLQVVGSIFAATGDSALEVGSMFIFASLGEFETAKLGNRSHDNRSIKGCESWQPASAFKSEVSSCSSSPIIGS